MVAVVAESMVGGTNLFSTSFHRRVIQCETSRALVLNLSGEASGVRAPPRTTTPLTEPSRGSRPRRSSRSTRQRSFPSAHTTKTTLCGAPGDECSTNALCSLRLLIGTTPLIAQGTYVQFP